MVKSNSAKSDSLKFTSESSFVGIMEVVYAILMAQGVIVGWEQFTHLVLPFIADLKITFSLTIKSALFTVACGLILIRFFFAPSKNLPPLIKKAKNKLWPILVFDVPWMLLHSALFYLICSRFEMVVMFDQTFGFVCGFSLLMVVNFLWLIRIKWCLGDTAGQYFVQWARNNYAHAIIILIAWIYLPESPDNFSTTMKSIALILLSISNSLFDLWLTAPAYFQKNDE